MSISNSGAFCCFNSLHISSVTLWPASLSCVFLSNACCGFHTLYFSTNLSQVFLHGGTALSVLWLILFLKSTASLMWNCFWSFCCCNVFVVDTLQLHGNHKGNVGVGLISITTASFWIICFSCNSEASAINSAISFDDLVSFDDLDL